MSARRFRYALDPLLLTRKWALDALLQELGDCNEALTKQVAGLKALEERMRKAEREWQATTGAAQVLSVQQFGLMTGFLSDLAAQERETQLSLRTLVQQRDELVERVVNAQRGLEAVEQHRDEMNAQFAQLRTNGDFKIADDQWNTLQARIAEHEA